MHELTVNLHMHTVYSDGSGLHQDIADAALKAGVDAVIVTDHNVLVSGPEKYYKRGHKRVLMLIGEEIHNQARLPQKSHLLVFNANRELATFASDPQALIDAVRRAGGLAFIAHPNEPAAPVIKETDITWEDWQVQGYHGIELWNALSEIKTIIPTFLHVLFYIFFPRFIAHGPQKETLKLWDELLTKGQRVVAIGGSDAHALKYRKGPLKATVFPYEFHFAGVNSHVFVPAPLGDDVEADKKMIYDAFAAGHVFVGYDLPASTKGFKFTAQSKNQNVIMGDEIKNEGGTTLQVWIPQMADIALFKDGQMVKSISGRQSLTHITTEPGVYRVEVHTRYLGKRRGWIFSNPIYVR
jgi:hypothetical protein